MWNVNAEIQKLVPQKSGRIAIMAPGRKALDYQSLCAITDGLAQALARLGLHSGDAVALVMPDGPEFLISFLAVTKVAICAPLNPGFQMQEFEFYLSDLNARALIVLTGIDTPSVAVAQRMQIPIIDVQPSDLDPAHPLSFSVSSSGLDEHKPYYEPDTALLLHTSATTGQPKLVPLKHGQLISMVEIMRESLPEADEGRVLMITPMFHLHCMLSILIQLFSGGAAICTPGFRPETFLDWMTEFRPTQYTANPTLHRAILSLCSRNGRHDSFRSLRFVSSAGAPLPDALYDEIERTMGVPVIEGYGLTEVGRVTLSPFMNRRKAGSVGKCLGVDVAIMDEKGGLLPFGCAGEIVLRGPTVMTGYAHNPEANRQAFRDGWFRTGDLGYVDEEGFLFLTGRIKEMINRGAEKILPYEIEEVLAQHPAVQEAAVFGIPHSRLGEDVGAAVVVRPTATVTALELRRTVAERLAGFKVPRRIIFVTDIPKGRTGKYQRAKLADYLGFHDMIEGTPYENPVGPLENKLAEIWGTLLSIEKIGRLDDFFNLGGDSLLGLAMLCVVEDECNCQLDPSVLAESTTLEKFAARVRDAQGGESAKPDATHARSGLVILQSKGLGTPLFLVDAWGGGALGYRQLVANLSENRPIYGVDIFGNDATDIALTTINAIALKGVATVRRVQPRGPYWLGGHSAGGFLAVELARQLVADGERVAGVILIDSDCFGWKQYEGAALIWVRHLTGRLRRIPYHVKALTHLPMKRWMKYMRDRMVAVKYMWDRMVAVTKACYEDSAPLASAVLKHKMTPVTFRVLLLCASEGEQERRERMVTRWSSIITHELLIKDIAGDHSTVMQEPHVKEVADEILRFLS